MYKPVPQTQTNNDGEESESELFNSSFNCDEKFLENEEHLDDFNHAEHQMEQVPMSTARKVALVLSIVNCVAFIIIFLWVLPCDYDTCRASPKVKLIEWKIIFAEKGVQKMTFASSDSSQSLEMIILLISPNALSSSSPSCYNNETNRILGLNSADGKIFWEKEFPEPIQYMNCSLVDVNKDGINDCLVFPVSQSILALNSLTGDVLWQLHDLKRDAKASRISGMKIVHLDSVNDINKDAVADIVAIMNDSVSLFFVGISARDGELLWQTPLNASCVALFGNASLTVSSLVSSSCIKERQDEIANFTSLLPMYGQSHVLSFQPCPKCIALTVGIPNSRFLFHRKNDNVVDYVVTASVNCSTDITRTLLAKRIVDA